MADNHEDLDPLSNDKKIAEKNLHISAEMIQQLEIRHRENQRQLTDLFKRVEDQLQIIHAKKNDSTKDVDGTTDVSQVEITDHDRILQLEKEVKERKLEKSNLEGKVRRNLIILQWRRLYTKLQEKSRNETNSNMSNLMENLETEDFKYFT